MREAVSHGEDTLDARLSGKGYAMLAIRSQEKVWMSGSLSGTSVW